ncbi:MAG: HU family DNA-binding protein [Myxococcota bacterium]
MMDASPKDTARDGADEAQPRADAVAPGADDAATHAARGDGATGALSWVTLVERAAARAGATKTMAGRVLDGFVDVAIEALQSLNGVRLKSLGTLSAEWHDGRVLRSPRDRRRMFLDGRYQVHFRASERLKQTLARRSPQLWKDQRHQSAWRLAETLLSDLELYHADKVPRDLAADAGTDEVMERCALAFGAQWRRAVQTFEAGVPAEVRTARNYLLENARDRWSRAPEARRTTPREDA